MTPKEREVMELALEALEELNNTNSYWWQEVDEQTIKKIDPAITAIKEALREHAMYEVQRLGQEIQPEQEPVAWATRMGEYAHIHWGAKRPEYPMVYEAPLYTTPPQRTWVGLTRRERFEIEKAMSKYYDYQHECKTVCLPEFAAAIEAKLKEKNTHE